MDILYFSSSLTPHLQRLVDELGLVDGMPFTLDNDYKFDTVINNFLHSLVVPQSPSPRTWRTYAEQLSLFFRFLASRGKTWHDATHDDLLVYYRIRRVREGQLKISSRSWNVFAAALKRFYEWAKRKNHILAVPFDYKDISPGAPYAQSGNRMATSTIMERNREKDIMYMTEADFRTRFLPVVAQTTEGIRNSLFCRLLMRSGLRAEEAIGVRLSMLPDPNNPTYAGRKTCPLTVVGKGNKERTVRVPKTWLRDALRYIEWDRADNVDEWKTKHPSADPAIYGDRGFLFLTAKGTPVTYASMYAMMRAAGEKAKLSCKSHPHMLRHSFAVYQLSAMIRELIKKHSNVQSTTSYAYQTMIQDPLRKLQKLLGHSCITTTFLYLDYVDDIDTIIDVTFDEEGFGNDDDSEGLKDTVE